MALAKASLWKLSPGQAPARQLEVQFNPESLKVTYSNQLQAANQGQASDNNQGSAAIQYVGRGTTKLAVTLWFDVTAEQSVAPGADTFTDVNKLTQKVIELIKVDKATAQRDQPIPAAVRFLWGSFQFDGIAESIEQSLEFFSSDGVPLRASITLNLTQQSISNTFIDRPATPPTPPGASLPSGAAPGTNPLTAATAGVTLQGMADAIGKGADWQAIAQANGIENPRLLAPGQLIDMNISASASFSASGSASASVSGSLSI